ncbi:MAG TPA: hypothetical protein VFV38_34190 [Ktedonobacteraceae bacterium]|nr:hypothetical protein [Ktedonobacteraceae bacterium]
MATRRLSQPLLGVGSTGGEWSQSHGNSRILDALWSRDPGVFEPATAVEGWRGIFLVAALAC